MSNPITKRREPFRFMLYLGLASSALLFGFIFLVFVKKELANQDIPVHLPRVFWLSTFSILLSSLFISLAAQAIRNEQFARYRSFITLTFLFALLFIVFQILGWQIMYESQITPANNTGGAFIYILSGLHLLHSLGGLIAITYLIKDAFSNTNYVDSYVYSVNPPNQLRLRLVSIYWHFVDVVWLIIFMFFLWHAS